MSISSQKVVSKPIGLHEVADLLHVKAVDVGAVCCAKDKINPGSKHKPLDSSIYPELTEEQMAAVNYGLDLYQCAVGTMNGENVGGGIYAIDQLGVQAQTWVYHSPLDSSTAKYRLTDFNGYKHKGQAYRWPVRFFPITETVATSPFENIVLRVRDNSEMAEVSGSDPFAIDGHQMSFDVSSNVKYIKSYGREVQNTRPTYTGIHVASGGYAGLTTRIKGYHRLTLVDANGRTTYDSGEVGFDFRQSDRPDPYDSLNRVGLSVDIATKTRGKGPGKARGEVVVTYYESTTSTVEKCQLQLTPIFSMSSFGTEWPNYMTMSTGIGVRIPECSGDWAANNHSYEKELLHYTDSSTGETVYCTDPMFIMLMSDGNNSMGYRYWFPTKTGNGDYITPGGMGFGVYGDLRTYVLTGLYMFYCNKEKVYLPPSGGVGTGTCTDVINTTNTVIFPAPYCKWDWDSIKKS